MSHHTRRHPPGDRPTLGSTPVMSVPDNVAGVYARQADELAAIVETLMRDERARHAKTMRTLQTLASSLGEQHVELDELAARLAGGDPR